MSERHEAIDPAWGDGAYGSGRLNAALARAVVRTHSEYRGRGPTKAHAFFRRNVVVVLMEDTQTRAEHALIDDGRAETVMNLRRGFRETMRTNMVSSVETLTGRNVTAFMSTNHIAPDFAAEVFVLDGWVPGPVPAVPP